MLIPGRLRSRLIVCVMSIMAQGAHRGRPVAAAPCTPGLRPAKSPLRGPFDLSLQASGRAEAASVQNTALSPHPCGLPRPSGNVSAILRPPAPAVSARLVNKLTTGRTNPRPGQAQPPPGTKSALRLLSSPGGAALTGPTRYEPGRGPCRPGKAQPPPGTKSAPCPQSLSGGAALARPTATCIYLICNGYMVKVSEAPPENTWRRR
ncbi:Uncharacterised protein [Klebsiella quasipneumoniae]|nr:Uncharacterised protein [Klebsiella quasipneumoniae]